MSVFRQEEWGILTWRHPCLNPTALPEEVLGSPGPRTTAKLPALSKCSSPISSHTHTNEQSKPRCLNRPGNVLGMETVHIVKGTYCADKSAQELRVINVSEESETWVEA